MNFRAPAPVARPAVQPSPAVVVVDESPPSSNEFSCVDCCFRCDSDYKWYHLHGKGKNLRKDSLNRLAYVKRTGYIYPSLINATSLEITL